MMEEELKGNISDLGTPDIWMDIDDVEEDLTSFFNDFVSTVSSPDLKQVLGKGKWSSLKERCNSINKYKDNDFSILVVGDFKRGKSTFINALIGEDIVPTNVTPETITINRITYGEKEKVEAILKDKRRVSLTRKEINCDNLESLISKLPAEIDHIKIELPIEWLKGVSIVDTPGTGDILKKYDAMVSKEIELSDAVIYVLSTLSPLSETDGAFLNAALKAQNKDKLLIAINMMDCLESKEDIYRVKNDVYRKLNSFLPNCKIFGISALDEFSKIMGLERPNLSITDVLDKEFAMLREDFNRELLERRRNLKFSSMLSIISKVISDIEGQILIIKHSLQMDKNKMVETLERLKNEYLSLSKDLENYKIQLNSLIDEMKEEAHKWMGEFLCEIEKSIDLKLYLVDLELIQRHFTFFLKEKLKEAIEACLYEHVREINKWLRGIISQMQSSIREDLLMASKDSTTFAFNDDLYWTEFDTLNSIMVLLPLGLLVEFSKFLVSAGNKGKSNKVKEELIENIRNKMPMIKANLSKEIDKLYESLLNESQSKLEETLKGQLATMEAYINDGREINKCGEEEREIIYKQLSSLQGLIAQWRGDIASLENKLFMVR